MGSLEFMTHDELLAKINEASPSDKIDAGWQSALRAVVELHKPIEYVKQFSDGEMLQGEYVCNVCDWDYPCQTIQAIEKELK